MNVVKRHSLAMHPGDACTSRTGTKSRARIRRVRRSIPTRTCCPTRPSEEVAFHTSTTARKWTLQVYREGNVPALCP